MNFENPHRVLFERPDLNFLTRNYVVVDMHFHSHYSDGFNFIDTIARRARELGIGVAITDHNEIQGALEMDRHRDVLSIPGIEVTSREGTHVLVYFYEVKSLKDFYRRYIQPNLGQEIMSSTALEMEAIIRAARNYSAVVIFPHPYCGSYTGIANPYFSEQRLERLLQQVDGVEVINSENLKRWNLRSALLGFNLGKAVTGGSDGHRLPQLGRVVSYAACKKSRRAFLDAVRKGRSKVVGKEIDIIRKVTSNGVKLRTNLKNYPDLVEKNLRYGYTVMHTKSKLIRDNVIRSLNEKKDRQRRRRFAVNSSRRSHP